MISQKELHDGQKTKFKTILVAQGFQEVLKPQRDSSLVFKENSNLLIAVAANENFKLRSMDIRADFLQAKELDRDVYLMPPEDVRKEGYIWKLKKLK